MANSILLIGRDGHPEGPPLVKLGMGGGRSFSRRANAQLGNLSSLRKRNVSASKRFSYKSDLGSFPTMRLEHEAPVEGEASADREFHDAHAEWVPSFTLARRPSRSRVRRERGSGAGSFPQPDALHVSAFAENTVLGTTLPSARRPSS